MIYQTRIKLNANDKTRLNIVNSGDLNFTMPIIKIKRSTRFTLPYTLGIIMASVFFLQRVAFSLLLSIFHGSIPVSTVVWSIVLIPLIAFLYSQVRFEWSIPDLLASGDYRVAQAIVDEMYVNDTPVSNSEFNGRLSRNAEYFIITNDVEIKIDKDLYNKLNKNSNVLLYIIDDFIVGISDFNELIQGGVF